MSSTFSRVAKKLKIILEVGSWKFIFVSQLFLADIFASLKVQILVVGCEQKRIARQTFKSNNLRVEYSKSFQFEKVRPIRSCRTEQSFPTINLSSSNVYSNKYFLPQTNSAANKLSRGIKFATDKNQNFTNVLN